MANKTDKEITDQILIEEILWDDKHDELIKKYMGEEMFKQYKAALEKVIKGD